MIQRLSILFLLVIILGCEQIIVDKDTEGEELMQVSRDWSRIAGTGNIDSTLMFWSDTAVLMSPGDTSLVGKESIREMLEGTSKIPGFKISWEPKKVVVSKCGDMAYMIEENQITVNDSLGKPVTQYNKSVTVC